MYIIVGKVVTQFHKTENEQLDQTETREDAEQLASEYQLAFGSDWDITFHENQE
jgi:hypothetical protein